MLGQTKELLSRLPEDVDLVGVEVGVWKGGNAATLLRHRPWLQLHLVDLWSHNPNPDYAPVDPGHAGRSEEESRHVSHQAQRRFADNPRVKLYRMDSVAAAAWFADKSLDFVFIDADHSYTGVARDLPAWWPKIRPGGLLCGHDFAPKFPGVIRAVREFHRACARCRLPVDRGLDATWFIRVPDVRPAGRPRAADRRRLLTGLGATSAPRRPPEGNP